jgi:hypothetical protein
MPEIKDKVVVIRTFGITVRHDIKDEHGKDQRGWNGLRLRDKNAKPAPEEAFAVLE